MYPLSNSLRLEERPDVASRIALARALERRRDRGRVMREVVDDRDAAHDAAHFHAPLDALERLESALNLLRGQPAQACNRRVGERIQDVVASRHRGAEAKPLLPLPPR